MKLKANAKLAPNPTALISLPLNVLGNQGERSGFSYRYRARTRGSR